MYRFSRSIYRELAPRVVEDEWDPTECANKQKVLDACEGAICRLTYDRRYFARPARTLFNDVRAHFTMSDQLFVWTVIERNIGLALEFLYALARRRRARWTAAGVPGAYAQGHAVSAPAAPRQRLLPVAQAPGGDVRGASSSRSSESSIASSRL